MLIDLYLLFRMTYANVFLENTMETKHNSTTFYKTLVNDFNSHMRYFEAAARSSLSLHCEKFTHAIQSLFCLHTFLKKFCFFEFHFKI